MIVHCISSAIAFRHGTCDELTAKCNCMVGWGHEDDA